MPETHRSYWVYILANRKRGTIYTGVTNSLHRRVWQHKSKRIAGFTRHYGVDRLVYFEEFRDVGNAIAREKQIKGWLRARKIALIEQENAMWDDLSSGWYSPSAIAPIAARDSEWQQKMSERGSIRADLDSSLRSE